MKPVTIFISGLLTLYLIACSPIGKQEQPETVSLIKTLALGRMTELNAQSPDTEHELLVRLYEVPIFENDCFVETHGICQHEYFITVSTYDEYPETNVYKIPYQGELQGFTWLKDEVLDQEQIELQFARYTRAALANNPALVNQKRIIIVKLGTRTFEAVIK